MVQCFIDNGGHLWPLFLCHYKIQKYVSGNAVSQNANFTNLINMFVGKRRFPKCKFN